MTFNSQTLGTGQLTTTGSSSSVVNLLLNSIPLSPGNNNVMLTIAETPFTPAQYPGRTRLTQSRDHRESCGAGRDCHYRYSLQICQPGSITFNFNPHAAASYGLHHQYERRADLQKLESHVHRRPVCNFVVAFDRSRQGSERESSGRLCSHERSCGRTYALPVPLRHG